jgi:OOP family OmpA-OmpF porin
MRKIFFTLFTLILSYSFAQAQSLKKLADRAKQKVEQKVSQKVDEKIDKTIDDAIDGKKKDSSSDTSKKSGNGNSKVQTSDTTTSKSEVNKNKTQSTSSTDSGIEELKSLKTYSKYDFIPGEKIVALEDFSKEAVGDFPSQWNTNASAEIVTVDGETGKWLQLNQKGIFIPEFIKDLPENFTLEYDLLASPDFQYTSTGFTLILSELNKDNPWNLHFFGNGIHGFSLRLRPNDYHQKAGQTEITTYKNGTSDIHNETSTDQFLASSNTKRKVHVAIWRQNQRIRIYLNESKIYDLPRALMAGTQYNVVTFSTEKFRNEEEKYLISNIRLAVGKPDTRHKLVNEGKFSTTGIYFDTNSDQIKPNSYGVLKDIASVLSEEPGLKIKIIGHTDSDGDEKINQALSEKRAAAVKSALQTEFSIDAGRISTEGKGASQPVDQNTTAEGKANNRRVEFIKM